MKKNFTKSLMSLISKTILVFIYILITIPINAQILNKTESKSYFKLKTIGEETVIDPIQKTKDSVEIYKKLNAGEIKSFVKAGSEIRFKPFGVVIYNFNESKEVIVLNYTKGCFEIKTDYLQGYIQEDQLQTTVELLKLIEVKKDEELGKLEARENKKSKEEDGNRKNEAILSQNRSNQILPVLSINKGILLNATGWLKNKSGQWIHSKNKIPEDLGMNQERLDNYEKYSLGQDNFISYQLKDIKIKDSTYSIIIKKYKDGFYDYKLIQEGWNPEISCEYYIFSKTEMNKVKNITPDLLHKMKLKIIYSGFVLYLDSKIFTDIKLSQEINSKINESLNKKLEEENIKKKNELLFKTEYKKYGIKYKVDDDIGITEEINFLYIDINYLKNKGMVQFYFYDTTFGNKERDRYYETDYINFNKFFKI